MSIAGKILKIDLSDQKIEFEPTSSYVSDYIGGVGIGTKFLWDQVPPETLGTDPENLLTINAGPLTGTLLGNKANIMVKSPLFTNKTISMAGFGGQFPSEMKFAGYDNIIVSGKADKPVYIHIDNNHIEIKDASHLWGKGTSKTQEMIKAELNDPDIQVLCIGPAGENMVAYSMLVHDIQNTASKGGFGAVMGSKNLKAIAVRGTKGLSIAHPEAFWDIFKEFYNWHSSGMVRTFTKLLQKEGQARHMQIHYTQRNTVPWGYFDTWEIPEKEKAYLIDDFQKKHLVGAVGCAFCMVQCAENYKVPGIGNGGCNCIAYLQHRYMYKSHDINLWWESNQLSNDYGLDAINTSSIIGWLMKLYEEGIITAKDTDGVPMEWGSKKAVLTAIEKIAKQEGFGKILKDGVMPASEIIGKGSADFAVQLRNSAPFNGGQPYRATMGAYLVPAAQEIWIHPQAADAEAAYPMVSEYYGITYEEAEQRQSDFMNEFSAKHTSSKDSWREDNYDEFGEYAFLQENVITAMDITGHCDFLSDRVPHFGSWWGVQEAAKAVSATTGLDITTEKFLEVIQRRRMIELAYYHLCSEKLKEDEVLPYRFLRPRPDGYHKGQGVNLEEFEKILVQYYTLRKCDLDTGYPKSEELKRLGLDDVEEKLRPKAAKKNIKAAA